MEIPQDKLAAMKKKAEAEYLHIGSVYCPYLDDNVHFSTEGFEHLLFRNKGRARRSAEQYTRLRLLPLAVEVIRKSHTLQETDRQVIVVRQKLGGKWNSSPRWTTFYVFIALIRPNIRIKVIVREVDGGQKHFYSLFPSWKVSTGADGQRRKSFYSENPADL